MVLAVLAVACGGGTRLSRERLPDGTGARRASRGFAVRWTRTLAPPFEGRSVPVERGGAASDPLGGRVYVGSSFGILWALGAEGEELYRYETGLGMESPPLVDPARDVLFLAFDTGEVHALSAGQGKLRWKADLGSPVTAPMVLSSDAVYVVTDDGSVAALGRKDGSVLWRYRRPATSGFKIAGQAGMLLQDGRVVTGFSDGVIASLDAGDGHKHWQVDTSLDVLGDDRTRFPDVDTTPVYRDGMIYAASFSGGLYVLDADRGVVERRVSELTGVTGLVAGEHALVASSGDLGVVCLDLPALTVRWRHASIKGAPGQPRLHDGKVFVAESDGAMLVMDLANGLELGRLESGHGFDAAPQLEAGRGFILSNAAQLFAFTY